jgi:hypothetical protein
MFRYDFQKPLVLILGGAFQTPEHMKPFSLIYASLNYKTCVTIGDFNDHACFDCARKRQTAAAAVSGLESLMAEESEVVEEPRPVVIQAFSNGGACIYPFVRQLLEEDDRFKLVGAVLDSAPGPMSFLPYLRNSGR